MSQLLQQTSQVTSPDPARAKGARPVSTIITKDGTKIYYKDWGEGPVVTFSHGWPLNADAWDGQMLFLAQQGYRVVAHDRRCHGRSSQATSGNDMDGYADDLAALIDALDLVTRRWSVTPPVAARSRDTSGGTAPPGSPGRSCSQRFHRSCSRPLPTP